MARGAIIRKEAIVISCRLPIAASCYRWYPHHITIDVYHQRWILIPSMCQNDVEMEHHRIISPANSKKTLILATIVVLHQPAPLRIN